MKNMKKTVRTHMSLIVLATVLFFSGGMLAGCGGGGGDGGSTTPTTTPGLSSGAIQGLGSVIVNGVTFNTDAAAVVIEGDDNPSLADLSEGMIVRVDGSFDDNGTTGTANTVTFEDTLEGPVSAIQETTTGLVKELTILGHKVIVENGVTGFDDTPPVTFGNLLIGQVLEISGHMDASGMVQATFVQKKAENLADFTAAGGIFEIMGTVSNLDTAASTFSIHLLNVSYAGITPRNGSLANGALVEVKGNAFDLGVLTATDVELKNALGANIAKVHVEGLIAGLNTGAGTFSINGQSVNYQGATFRGGIEADLADGIKVEAEGPIVSGVLQAVKVTFKESVRIEGNVAAINLSTFTLEGLGGISIAFDANLSRIDNLGSFADLAPGNEVKVRARQAAGGALIATRLELVNAAPTDRTILQGPISNLNPSAGTFDILSVSVNTSTVSQFEIEDVLTDRTGFFSLLSAGDIVKARADLPALTWDQVEIELEDDN